MIRAFDLIFTGLLLQLIVISPISGQKTGKQEAVFDVIKEHPIFFPDIDSCIGVINDSLKSECFEENLMTLVYSHLEYPDLAKANGIEGTVVIQLNFNPDEKTFCTRILRDIGAGTAKAALRAVNQALQDLLSDYERCKWQPGKVRGNPVRAYWHIPVKFKLNNKD